MTLHTTQLTDLLERIRDGDTCAADELLNRCQLRLEAMASSMLRRYPKVAAREQTADLLQEASLSLLAALQELDLKDTRAFYNLVSEHMRRRLLDMARKHRERAAPSVPANPDADIDRWTDLHEAAERLPAELREAFSLHFYHAWTFAEMAPLLGVSAATARRRWFEALAALSRQLQDFPE